VISVPPEHLDKRRLEKAFFFFFFVQIYPISYVAIEDKGTEGKASIVERPSSLEVL
jgi:hypothetical protein